MRRRRTALWSLVGLTALAAALVAIWRTSDLGRTSADLEHQKAAAKAEGVPIDASDLRRLLPPVADMDNAAPLYRQGFAEMHAADNFRPLSDRFLDTYLLGKAKPDDLKRVETSLAAGERALEFVVEGSKRKACRFDRQWDQGIRLLFPEFADERNAVRALVMRAILANDPSAVARDLQAAARVSAHAGSEPVLISVLVGASAENTVGKGVRALGARGGAWAAAARSALDAFGPLPDAHRYLAGESVSSRSFVSDLSQVSFSDLAKMSMVGEGEPAPPTFALRLVKLKPVRDAFEARAIEHWRSIYAALPADPLDWRGLQKAVNRPYPNLPSAALLPITTPVFSAVGDLAAKMAAGRALTRAALDLESGRPANLARDPFGTGPLKMRHDETGWTLWSVGPDGVDQGGKARGRNDDSAYDLVVNVPAGR